MGNAYTEKRMVQLRLTWHLDTRKLLLWCIDKVYKGTVQIREAMMV